MVWMPRVAYLPLRAWPGFLVWSPSSSRSALESSSMRPSFSLSLAFLSRSSPSSFSLPLFAGHPRVSFFFWRRAPSGVLGCRASFRLIRPRIRHLPYMNGGRLAFTQEIISVAFYPEGVFQCPPGHCLLCSSLLLTLSTLPKNILGTIGGEETPPTRCRAMSTSNSGFCVDGLLASRYFDCRVKLGSYHSVVCPFRMKQ